MLSPKGSSKKYTELNKSRNTTSKLEETCQGSDGGEFKLGICQRRGVRNQ